MNPNSNPTCDTCAYFTPDLNARSADVRSTAGQCHRHPPTTMFMPQKGGVMGAATNFPLVNNHTWCGEHSERQLDVLFKRRDELIGLAKDAYQTMTNGCLPIVFPPLSEVKKEDGQS